MSSRAKRRINLLKALIRIEEVKLLDTQESIASLRGMVSRNQDQIRVWEDMLGSGRYLEELSDLDISMYSIQGDDLFEYIEGIKSTKDKAASMVNSGIEYAKELRKSIDGLKELLARESQTRPSLPRIEIGPDGTPYMVGEAAYSEPEDESEFEYTHPTFDADSAPKPGYSTYGGLKIKTPGGFDKN